MQGTGFREQFAAIADAWALAQGIVDTVREPVLVLDKDLRVIAASRSFYSAFKVSPEDTNGRLLYALGDGQWDIPKLRVLLDKIIPEQGVMDGYEVEHEFPGLGSRTMCLNARQVFYEGGAGTTARPASKTTGKSSKPGPGAWFRRSLVVPSLAERANGAPGGDCSRWGADFEATRDSP